VEDTEAISRPEDGWQLDAEELKPPYINHAISTGIGPKTSANLTLSVCISISLTRLGAAF
jgi:hypothetical protein